MGNGLRWNKSDIGILSIDYGVLQLVVGGSVFGLRGNSEAIVTCKGSIVLSGVGGEDQTDETGHPEIWSQSVDTLRSLV